MQHKLFFIRKHAEALRDELEAAGLDGYHTMEQVFEELDLVDGDE